MSRKIAIPVRSFGEDAPLPEKGILVDWIGRHRGQEGDLTTCLLDLSLDHQEGVHIPCIGGMHYLRRWMGSIGGAEEGRLIGEPVLDFKEILMDLSIVSGRRRNLWWSIPAPHLLPLEDHYFLDEDEFLSAISDCYLDLMRCMRDRGIAGHILLCERLIEEELEILASRKRLFCKLTPSSEDLPVLLEFQSEIAVPRGLISDLVELLGEYSVRRVSLFDPSPDAFAELLEHLDIANMEVAGYCTEGCESYWRALISKAFATL